MKNLLFPNLRDKNQDSAVMLTVVIREQLPDCILYCNEICLLQTFAKIFPQTFCFLKKRHGRTTVEMKMPELRE
jgi:hypothetical protein